MGRSGLAILLAATVVAAGCERLPGTSWKAIAEDKRGISAGLFDPASAEFRRLKYVQVDRRSFPQSKYASVLCGEINGKNRAGAYAGFERFMSGSRALADAQLDPQNSVTAAEDDRAFQQCKDAATAPLHGEAQRQLALTYCNDASEKTRSLQVQQSFDDTFRKVCGELPVE